jgi:hypothetical protein
MFADVLAGFGHYGETYRHNYGRPKFSRVQPSKSLQARLGAHRKGGDDDSAAQ